MGRDPYPLRVTDSNAVPIDLTGSIVKAYRLVTTEQEIYCSVDHAAAGVVNIHEPSSDETVFFRIYRHEAMEQTPEIRIHPKEKF